MALRHPGPVEGDLESQFLLPRANSLSRRWLSHFDFVALEVDDLVDSSELRLIDAVAEWLENKVLFAA
jgi:hypothetical protein